jgi:hypothetical protein
LGRPAGFLGATSANLRGVFVIPKGHIIIGGRLNLETGFTQISARSLGSLRGTGTLSVIDDEMGGPTQFAFQLKLDPTTDDR